MSCGHCVRGVKEALMAVAGVSSVELALEDPVAVIEHDDGVAVDDMVAAVHDDGYEATPL